MRKSQPKPQKKLPTREVEEMKKTMTKTGTKSHPQSKASTAAKTVPKEAPQTKAPKEAPSDTAGNTREVGKRKPAKEASAVDAKSAEEELKSTVSSLAHSDKVKKPVHKEEKQLYDESRIGIPEVDDDTPDMDQMMADIMGGFSSLQSSSKQAKPKKHKLPFIPSLEVKTSREIIRELNDAVDMKDKPLQLSLLKGLEDHEDMAVKDRVKYFEQEAKLAIELGHDETAALAAGSLLKLEPCNVSGCYYYAQVHAHDIIGAPNG